jgi:hypothetical protein
MDKDILGGQRKRGTRVSKKERHRDTETETETDRKKEREIGKERQEK